MWHAEVQRWASFEGCLAEAGFCLIMAVAPTVFWNWHCFFELPQELPPWARSSLFGLRQPTRHSPSHFPAAALGHSFFAILATLLTPFSAHFPDHQPPRSLRNRLRKVSNPLLACRHARYTDQRIINLHRVSLVRTIRRGPRGSPSHA